jgi:hypothetical protein
MNYKVWGIIKSKFKNANIDVKADIIKATNLEGAINKFKKKYPKYIVFSVTGKSFGVWYNKDVEEEYKQKYGGIVT